MILTDYEMVFPMCGEVDEDGLTVHNPKGMVCDVDLVEALVEDMLFADKDCANAMGDLSVYRSTVENQDTGTVGELVMRADKYRSVLATNIAELLVTTVAVARARDITCSEIQHEIDKHAGLAM